MISKIVVQTAKDPIQPYITEKLKKYTSDAWTYMYFNDTDIKDFFNKNPLPELPKIEKLFDELGGAHKADLFRYYFLYVKGGVYIDSDALLTHNLDDITKDYSFFYVKTNEEQAFNGFIGCSPKNEIMYDLLIDAYNVELDQLRSDYHLLCKNLVRIVKKYKSSTIKEFHESGGPDDPYIATVDVAKNKTILHHYCFTKIIPKDLI